MWIAEVLTPAPISLTNWRRPGPAPGCRVETTPFYDVIKSHKVFDPAKSVSGTQNVVFFLPLRQHLSRGDLWPQTPLQWSCTFQLSTVGISTVLQASNLSENDTLDHWHHSVDWWVWLAPVTSPNSGDFMERKGYSEIWYEYCSSNRPPVPKRYEKIGKVCT